MLSDVPSSLLQAVIALFMRASCTKAQSNKCRPRPPLEEENGEDNAKAQAESRFYQEVGEAVIPLAHSKSAPAFFRDIVLRDEEQ